MRRAKPVPINALTVAKLLRMLIDENHTRQELADGTGLRPPTLGKFLRALIKEGVIHIGAWEQDKYGRDVTHVYFFGPGKPAKRKKKTTSAERDAVYRARIKARKLNALSVGPTNEVTHEQV